MAKILAACLNCEHGPTIEPCGECESCVSIAHASSLDVIEMDAASNNSVDDIRELRESVAYSPVSGRSKVYILDEAHMLSTAAWNAFLKTLEEPPPNTVFVLATDRGAEGSGDGRRSLPPIRLPPADGRADRLGATPRRAGESIEIPPRPSPPSPDLRRAPSATRSARSSSCSPTVATRSPSRTCWRCSAWRTPASWKKLVDAVDAGDARRALLALSVAFRAAATRAHSPLTSRCTRRELLVVQTLGELPAELSLTEEADARLRAQAERVDRTVVVRLLELLGAALEGVRAGADPRTRLELALLKAARPEVDASTSALLTRIERLERERGGVSAVAVDRVVHVPAAKPAPEVVEMRAADAADVAETSTAPATDHVPEPTPVAEVAHEPAPVEDLVPEPAPTSGGARAGESPPPVVSANDLESLQALWPAVVELVGMENRC